jgi:hypothetical protein
MDFFADAAGTMNILSDALSVRPSRLAATGTYFEFDPDPPRVLAEHFVKEKLTLQGRPLSGLLTFELHANHRDDLYEGLRVNDWIRLKSGTITELGKVAPVVVAERDINTLAEEVESSSFDSDVLGRFMTAAEERLKTGILDFFGDDE